MLTLPSAHAIGLAHFRMAGGWKSALLAGGIYFLAIGGLIILTGYASPFARGGFGPDFLTIWATGLLAFQCLVMIIFGGFRVSNCVRRDLTTQMIESHRLMPVAAPHAILGYLFHANLQILAVGAANILLGLMIASVAHVSLGDFFLAHAVIFCFAAFIWSLSCLLTFQMRYIAFVVAGSMLLGLCSSVLIFAVMFLPGLALLCSPLGGETIFSLTRGNAVVRWNYPVAIGAQAVFFTLFFLGSCRRYRGAYAATFHPLVALLVLLTWSAVSTIGITGWTDLRFGPFRAEFDQDMHGWQILVSMASAMVLAALPLGSLVVTRPRGPRGVAYSALFIVLTAASVWVVSIADMVKVQPTFMRVMPIVSITLSHALTLFLLIFVLRRVRLGYAWLIGVGTVAVIWFGPLILVGILTLLDASGSDPHFSTLATLSPLGLLAATLTIDDATTAVRVNPLYGLLAQWLIPLILTVIAIPRRAQPANGDDRPE